MSKLDIIWGDSNRTIPTNFDYNLVVLAARDTNGVFVTYQKSDKTNHYYNVQYDSIYALGEFSERLGIQIGMHIMIQSYEHRQTG